MKKFYFTLLFMALFILSAGAQGTNWSFMAGANPGFGKLGSQIRHADDEVHHLDYKQSFGFSVELEREWRILSLLSEFRFVNYKFDEYSHSEKEYLFPLPSSYEDVHTYSVMEYVGFNFMKHEKIQIPFYFGLGTEYLYGAPYHNFTAQLGFRLRAKLYLTDHIALFGGLGYVVGAGGSKRGIKEGDDSIFLILTNRANYDLGISFAL